MHSGGLKMKECVKKNVVTENEMPTHESSLDSCVDFFGTIGSAREWEESDIINYFDNAFNEDPLIALKILFYVRDIRGGQGERKVFRVCLKYLRDKYPEIFQKNIHLVPEYGRWDDLFFCSNDIFVFSLIKKGLQNKDALLAKWLPRKGEFANNLRKYLELSPKQYRKLIVGLSNTVEQKMCAKEWHDINLSYVPSIAMNKYNKAFLRHIPEKVLDFMQDIKSGKTKIHADTLYPYDLYMSYLRGDPKDIVEAQWKALPNYMENNKNFVIPMCDTSGSMHVTSVSVKPISVSVSLGIYISERNYGPFKDAFFTFSSIPEIQYLEGSFHDRCEQLTKAYWDMDTNLERAFMLLLDIAKRERIEQDKMPDTILIISDMQFNSCILKPEDTALQMIERMYEEVGYRIPQIVFWNLNARIGQSPVRFTDKKTCLVSGCSPVILKSVLDGSILSPRKVMMKVVLSERYGPVSI